MKHAVYIRVLKNIFLSLFLILMGVNFVVYAFLNSAGSSDKYENRPKASFPSSDSIKTSRYFSQIESHFSDYFLLKYFYIGNINSIKHQMFNYSNDGSKVIYGKDGWVFYNYDDYAQLGMDEFCGLQQWSQKDVKLVKSNLATIKNWCTKHHIVFIPIICPDKQSIYPEMLPAVYKQYGDNHYEQLMNADTAEINLKKVFTEEKKSIPHLLYYSTDTHWNYLGAFLGAAEISKVLKKYFPFIQPLGLSDVTVTDKFTGEMRDLAKMAVSRNVVEKEYLQVAFEHPFPKKIRRLFVVEDSYYEYMKPAMDSLFSETVQKGTFKFSFDPQEVLAANPDVFIFEVVERNESLLRNDCSKFIAEDSASKP